MMDVVLANLKRMADAMQRAGHDLPDALLAMDNEEFATQARTELSNAIRHQFELRGEVMENLLRFETHGTAGVDLSELWTTWARAAPVMPPQIGSAFNDLGHSVLDSILSRRVEVVDAYQSLPGTARSLVHRELERQRTLTQMAWSIETGSLSAYVMGQRLERIEGVLRRMDRLDTPTRTDLPTAPA